MMYIVVVVVVVVVVLTIDFDVEYVIYSTLLASIGNLRCTFKMLFNRIEFDLK